MATRNRKRVIVSELDSEPSDLVSFLSASSVICFYSSLVHSLLARTKKNWLVKQAKRNGSFSAFPTPDCPERSRLAPLAFVFSGSYHVLESRLHFDSTCFCSPRSTTVCVLATCPAIKTPGVEGNPQQRRTSPVASPEEPRPVLDRFGLGAFPEDG